MLTDQELLNRESSSPVVGSNSVFEDGCGGTPPVSPRPTPGIVLTVEGSSTPEIIDVAQQRQHRRSTRRSSRRTRQASSSQHRSPSTSRMNAASASARQPQAQQDGHRLRDPGSGVSRSQSMRTARRPQSVDPTQRFRHRIQSIPNDMTLPSGDGLGGGQRLASNQSLPLPDDEDFLRLRNFAVTSKGVVNRGDSFRSKSRSSHSVASYGGGPAPATPGHHHHPQKEEGGGSSAAQDAAAVEAQEEAIQVAEEGGASAAPCSPKCQRYRVLVLGPPDVGKTALINQFMTSEYMCAYDNSQDEDNEKSVPVILNGSESELVFSEYQFTGDSNTNFCDMFSADAYLVVYSVTSKRSLQTAKESLKLIHKWDDVHTKALILVGNKTDLARHRVLSADDGRSLAIEECSKFIETSAGINHQVDELLVGILSQIRLKLSSREKALQKRESVSLGSAGGAKLRGGKCSGCAGCKAKGILKRILKKACSRSKSCDNLHVL